MDDNKAIRWRNRLFDAVHSYRLDPNQADKIAKRLRIPPLRPESNYDPMKSARWSLPMAVAWIAWKRLDLVAGLARESREQRVYARARFTNLIGPRTAEDCHMQNRPVPAIIGWSYEPIENVQAPLKLLDEEEAWLVLDEGAAFRGTWRPAMDTLWQAFGNGELEAVAYDASGGLAPIQPYEWQELVAHYELDAVALRLNPGAVRYHSVTVSRAELIGSFHAPLSSVSVPAPVRKVGAPRTYPIEEYMREARRLWDEHGGFVEGDHDFSRRSHLVTKLEKWAEKKHPENIPDRKTVTRYVDRFLAEMGYTGPR